MVQCMQCACVGTQGKLGVEENPGGSVCKLTTDLQSAGSSPSHVGFTEVQGINLPFGIGVEIGKEVWVPVFSLSLLLGPVPGGVDSRRDFIFLGQTREVEAGGVGILEDR